MMRTHAHVVEFNFPSVPSMTQEITNNNNDDPSSLSNDPLVQAITIPNSSSSITFSSTEVFNRMKCVEDFSSLMQQFIAFENSFKEGDVKQIKREQLRTIRELNTYQYNTSITLSSLSQDYDEQLKEIQDRLESVKSQIQEHKINIIPSLNQELENERKHKQFNEEYNLISENVLKKPSTVDLKQQLQTSLDEVEKMKLEGEEKKKKIEYYEKQMELLFVATNDLLSTFKVQ